MSARFWKSTSVTWRLARFAVLVLVAFIALQGFVDTWIAAGVGVVAATLLLIDDVLSHRAEGAGRGSGAAA